MALGAVAFSTTGQTSDACSSTFILIAAGHATQADCAVISLIYHAAFCLMALGATLILGAFVLTLDSAPKVKADHEDIDIKPGWYRNPETDKVGWWTGDAWTEELPAHPS